MNYLKISKITVVIAGSLVMQSCFVAKEYQSPNIETEKLFRTEQIKDSVSLATV